MIIDEKEYIAHFGIPGMKWGIRKSQSSNGSQKNKSSDSSQKSGLSKNQKIAVAVGAGVLAAGIVTTAIVIKHKSNVKLKDIAKASSKTASLINKTIEEPKGIVYITRTKHIGFRPIRSGGLKDAIPEFDKAGFDKHAGEFFKRYGDKSEKVAVQFLDPLGRKDRSGRVIPHSLILPSSISSKYNSLEDVKENLWPIIQDTFSEIYDLPQ